MNASTTRLAAISLLLASTGALAVDVADVSTGDEHTLYQIEIVLFAYSRFDERSEHWNAVEMHYPRNMLLIEGAQPEGSLPATLWQLNDQRAYESLVGNANAGPEGNTRDDEPALLFERYSRSRAPERSPGALNEQDLMSGLTVESAAPAAAAATGGGESAGTQGEPDQADESRAAREARLAELLAPAQDPTFTALASDRYMLSAVANRLRRSPSYRLLYHVAWRQPIAEVKDALPVLIEGGARYDDLYELDGTITISRARYLHIDTRLWFTRFARIADAMPGSDSTLAQEGNANLARAYPALYQYESDRRSYVPEHTFEMVQSRRMRSDRLHYLDHPAFGMLIEITPVEEEEAEQLSAQ